MRIFESQVKPLIHTALNEDIKGGDITTDALTLKSDPIVRCEVIAKEQSVVCGLPVFSMVIDMVSGGDYKIDFLVNEGDSVLKSRSVISFEAKASTILYAERTALNFLQHLSGIATASDIAANELRGLKTKVLDTRKTVPGLRALQKYAVKTGGGENHRFDLSSGILIKDNHIKLAGGIKNAVSMVKGYNSGLNFKIEVETANLGEVKEALDAKADVIMLDNMDPDTMKDAVCIIGGNALTEASGNIKTTQLRSIAELTCVDYISMGCLTNSVTPADFSLNFIV